MNKEYYKQYYILEREHWWFKARLQILERLVLKYLTRHGQSSPNILNAGIATGATSEMLSKFGKVESMEYDEDCCRFVRDRLGLSVTQGSLTELPYPDNSFDLICAFDVVEHIEDDNKAVQEMHRCLRPGGLCITTVPAFQFLWSEHDEINHHFRRYERKDYTNIYITHGFNIDYSTYFNSFLFLPIALARVIGKLFSRRKDLSSSPKSDFEKFKPGGLSNQVFEWIFLCEASLLTRQWKFPAGVSIFSVAIKNRTTHGN